jgi:hypothetical protein
MCESGCIPASILIGFTGAAPTQNLPWDHRRPLPWQQPEPRLPRSRLPLLQLQELYSCSKVESGSGAEGPTTLRASRLCQVTERGSRIDGRH